MIFRVEGPFVRGEFTDGLVVSERQHLGDPVPVAVAFNEKDADDVAAALNLARFLARGDTDTVAALTEALRAAGFVDPVDDTVPKWPDPVDPRYQWHVPAADLAQFFLAWQAARPAAAPEFGVPGCSGCPSCRAATGDCARCGQRMRAAGSELCAGCDTALDAEVSARGGA